MYDRSIVNTQHTDRKYEGRNMIITNAYIDLDDPVNDKTEDLGAEDRCVLQDAEDILDIYCVCIDRLALVWELVCQQGEQ